MKNKNVSFYELIVEQLIKINLFIIYIFFLFFLNYFNLYLGDSWGKKIIQYQDMKMGMKEKHLIQL